MLQACLSPAQGLDPRMAAILAGLGPRRRPLAAALQCPFTTLVIATAALPRSPRLSPYLCHVHIAVETARRPGECFQAPELSAQPWLAWPCSLPCSALLTADTILHPSFVRCSSALNRCVH